MFLGYSVRKFIALVFCLYGLVLFAAKNTLAQNDLTPSPQGSASPTPTVPMTFEQEKEKLELERIELENEKLQFEMDKLKAQATKTTVDDRKNSKEETALFQQKLSDKAEALAKDNKDKANLLILDLVNNEVWNKGIRYNLFNIQSMAEEQKIPVKKYLDKRDLNGDERNRYVIRNISLLRYNGRTRGILTVKAPALDEDFRVLTLDNISFDSTIGEVRDAYHNEYFVYDGEGHADKLKWLRYTYSRGLLDFSDKLEFGFDKDGKFLEIRYGVLDEN